MAFRMQCLKSMLAAFSACFAMLFCLPSAIADMADIPVPLVTIQAGKRIESGDLAAKNFYVSETAARLFATSHKDVEGKIAKRALISGRPIALAFLRLAGTVVQGQPTKVILKKNGLVITAMLIPLQSGATGQIVDALNPESGKIVKVVVNADGSLQIGAQ